MITVRDLKAALQEADTLMGHDDAATEWRERWARLWEPGHAAPGGSLAALRGMAADALQGESSEAFVERRRSGWGGADAAGRALLGANELQNADRYVWLRRHWFRC